MPWREFTDILTGGEPKTCFRYVFVEGDDAVARFESEFEHDPAQESCECSVEDFPVSTFATLEEATAYLLDCRYADRRETRVEEPAEDADAIEPLDDFVTRPEVRVIPSE